MRILQSPQISITEFSTFVYWPYILFAAIYKCDQCTQWFLSWGEGRTSVQGLICSIQTSQIQNKGQYPVAVSLTEALRQNPFCSPCLCKVKYFCVLKLQLFSFYFNANQIHACLL